MKYQRQPSGSLFCQRSHMLRKKPTSQRMKAIHKEVKRSLEYMPPIMLNRNNNVDRRDDVEKRAISHTSKAFYSSKMVHEEDRQDKVITLETQRNPLEDRNITLPNTLLVSNKMFVRFGKSTMLAPSPNTMKQSMSSRFNNGLIPLSKGITQPKSSRFRDGLSSESLVRSASLWSKDDSNVTSRSSKKSHPSRVVHNTTNMSAHMAENVDALDQCNNLLTSMSKAFVSKRRAYLDQEEDIVVRKSNKRLQFFKSNEVVTTSKGSKFSMKDHRHNLGNSSFLVRVTKSSKDLSCHQRVKLSCMGNNMEQNVDPQTKDGRTEDENFKVMMNELPEEMPRTDDDNDTEEAENFRLTKKWKISKKYKDADGGEQNLVGDEDGTDELITENVTKDHSMKVSTPFVSKSVNLKHYSSLPIDEPIWSGIFKIGGKGYVSLAAYLSSKSCEKAWKLSGSLLPVVQVTKLSRLEAWPKISFEASRPTDDSIALYFLPHEMRPDEELDQLVKEVVEKDMVLRAVVDEAEMLIFPSILLPEQYQTFQGKDYLWGVFKRREDNIQEHGTGRCKKEEQMEKQQHASRRGVGKEGIGQEPMAPSLARSNASTRLAEGPAEAAASLSATATAMSANHARISSSLGIPQGRTFGFVVRQTPRTEQLIQEIEREGAVVFAIRGEMIGLGLGQVTAAE